MARRDDKETEDQLGFNGSDEHTNGSAGAVGLLERPENSEGAGDAPTSNGSSSDDEPDKPKREPKVYGPGDIVGVMVRVPFELKTQIDATADEQKVSTPQIITRMIAEAYEFALPEAAKKSRAKYATEDDKKKAQKDASDKKRLQIRALLAAVESGQIQVDVDALVANLQAKQAAEEAAKAATTTSEGEDTTTTVTAPEGELVGAAS